MPSIIIVTYLVVLHVMLCLDCVIEISHWGTLCIEFFLFVIFTMLTCSVFVRSGIASKPCSPGDGLRVIYVLICYCPLLCGLLILVVLDLWEWCALVLCVLLLLYYYTTPQNCTNTAVNKQTQLPILHTRLIILT
jgi:hypothetical protein